jgi:hypothetical protein
MVSEWDNRVLAVALRKAPAITMNAGSQVEMERLTETKQTLVVVDGTEVVVDDAEAEAAEALQAIAYPVSGVNVDGSTVDRDVERP